ncbi:MAG: c-type cytochrome [Candidatus Rokuibacteriota bacterium]
MRIVGRAITVAAAAAALVVGAGVALVSAQDTWKECEDAKFKGMKNPQSGAASVAAGKKSAETNCVTCHGASGKGDGVAAAALNPKPADWTSDKVKKDTDGALFCRISNGRGPMPPWKHLPQKERWDLVSYVRSLGGPPAKAPAKK